MSLNLIDSSANNSSDPPFMYKTLSARCYTPAAWYVTKPYELYYQSGGHKDASGFLIIGVSSRTNVWHYIIIVRMSPTRATTFALNYWELLHLLTNTDQLIATCQLTECLTV